MGKAWMEQSQLMWAPRAASPAGQQAANQARLRNHLPQPLPCLKTETVEGEATGGILPAKCIRRRAWQSGP